MLTVLRFNLLVLVRLWEGSMLWHSFGTEPSATMATSQVMSMNSYFTYTVSEHHGAILQ